MPRVKVNIERAGGRPQMVTIDTDATKGATLGSNVYLPSGAVGTPATVLEWLGLGSGGADIRNGYGILISGTSPKTINVNRAANFDWQGQHTWELPLHGPNGTAALPAFTFGSDPDNGLYRVGADNPGISTGGALRWDVNSTRTQQNVPAYVVMTVADNTTQPLFRADVSNTGATDSDRFEVSAPFTSGTSAAALRMGMWDVPFGGAGARGFRWDMTQTGSAAAQMSLYRHHNSDTGVELMRFVGDASQVQVPVGDVAFFPDNDYGFSLAGRNVAGLAVPYFRPNTNTTQIALDVFPRGAPGNFTSNTGVAWVDICSTDIITGGANYECLRLGILSGSDSHVSAAAGGSGVVRNLRLQINGGNVGIGVTAAPTWLLTANGTSTPALALQDTAVDRFFFALATAANNFFTGAADGDHIIRGMGGSILLGSNSSTPVPSITVAPGTPGNTTFGGRILQQNGTAALPSIGWSGDLNNGLYYITADSWGVSTAGVLRFQYGAAGQFGIGGATYGTANTQAIVSGGASAAPSWQTVLVDGQTQTLSGVKTWSGQQIFTGIDLTTTGTTAVGVGVRSGQPITTYVSSGAAADAKIWRVFTNTVDFTIGTVDDAYSATRSALQFTRSGLALTSLSFGNTTDLAPSIFNGVVRLRGYTVATLPAGTVGDTAYVTDALVPVFGAAVAAGGAIVVPVFRDATQWIVG